MKVALTFDAENVERSGDGKTAWDILNALDHARVPATFFVQAGWARAFPEIAKHGFGDGHLIGSHGYAHDHWNDRPPIDLTTDILAAQRTIIEVTGVSPKPWFRTPYGDNSKAVRDTLEEEGYQNVLWNVDSNDWREPDVAATIYEKVAGYIWSPVIALFHTWSEDTSRDLPRIITELKSKGHVEFVTVADL